MLFGNIFEDFYREGEDIYYKKVDIKKHTFKITRNGDPITLEQWNAAVNRLYPMSLKERHGFSLVRIKEKMRRRFLARMVLRSKPRVIADIGTESGHIAKLLLDQVEKMYCIDLDPEMVNLAVKSLDSDKVTGVVSAAERIELPDNSIDVLLAASILEHLPNPADVVKEFRRVVRKGGRIVISVPNDLVIVWIKRILRFIGAGRILGGLAGGLAMGHIQIFSLVGLRKVAQKGGRLIQSGYLLPHFLDIFAVVEK